MSIDEVRNRANRVADAATDFAKAVRDIPVAQKAAAAAGVLAAAASAGFFLGSRRRRP